MKMTTARDTNILPIHVGESEGCGDFYRTKCTEIVRDTNRKSEAEHLTQCEEHYTRILSELQPLYSAVGDFTQVTTQMPQSLVTHVASH